MEKLIYDPSQKPFLIKAFEAQIEDLKFQLKNVYSLLYQLDTTLVDPEYAPLPTVSNITKSKVENPKRDYANRDLNKDYFNRTKEILELIGTGLTSREILKNLYEYYPNEFDIDLDRKNIASLSAILTEKEKDGKIIRDKPEVGHAKFYLPEKEEKLQLVNDEDSY